VISSRLVFPESSECRYSLIKLSMHSVIPTLSCRLTTIRGSIWRHHL